MYTILFMLAGVKNIYKKIRQGTPWRGMDMYQIVHNCTYCTEEVGGLDGYRTATLRPAPPTIWEKNSPEVTLLHMSLLVRV